MVEVRMVEKSSYRSVTDDPTPARCLVRRFPNASHASVYDDGHLTLRGENDKILGMIAAGEWESWEVVTKPETAKAIKVPAKKRR